jgi:deoxyribodipyrimidine photo-lyase
VAESSAASGRAGDTSSDIDVDRLRTADGVAAVLTELGLDGGPAPVDEPTPGTPAARRALHAFLEGGDDYDERRSHYTDPTGTSRLSPYLHFGHISPVAVALTARDALGGNADGFIEELVVRRELAVNFVARTADYDSWSGLPDWARTTLDQHRDDPRPNVYTASELEHGETHDEVWNEVMATIRERGWVHNQLRMYWGKQIVDWTNTPEHAFRTLLELNNRYFLDGRDPNSFANVAWCFGLHDRAFKERAVQGKVRPLTTAALKRKDDLVGWLDGVTTGPKVGSDE